MSEAKKRLVSGVKPTGRPHIGNYFGAMKQFVDLQNEYDAYYMVADYHGLNFIQNGSEMQRLIIDLVKDYIGIGLDPKKSVLFKQSDVSEHTELAWIFDTITTMPYLMRAHAFKDAVGKNYLQRNPDVLSDEYFARMKDSNTWDQEADRIYTGIKVGTFNYPLLMAADILLYDADIVPVGADQKQHIEYARDTAQKFNNIFCQNQTFSNSNVLKIREEYDTFKILPNPLILESVAIVPGTDGQKMSKSYGNTIPLFATREEIEKAVMGIVTDSSGGRPENVYAIHKLLKTEAELEPLYTANEGSYRALKEALIEDLDTFIAPMRERRAQITDKEVKRVLEEGGKKAKAIASIKMADVKQKIGVTL